MKIPTLFLFWEVAEYELIDKVPYHLGQPLCGKWFWNGAGDGHAGAAGFCKKLGCTGGSLTRTDAVFDIEAFFVGDCGSDSDLFPNCQNGKSSSCDAGESVGVEITCDCTGEIIIFCITNKWPKTTFRKYFQGV